MTDVLPPDQLEPEVRDPVVYDPVERARWDEIIAAITKGRPGIVEMMEAIAEVELDIYQRQHAYIEAQWKVEPNPKAIRRAFVLREAIGLLQTVHENADRVRPILFPNAKKRAR